MRSWQPHRSAVWNHIAPASIQAPEPSSARQFKGVKELTIGNASVDFGKAGFGFGFVGGIILVHHVNVGVGRKRLSNPARDLARIVEQTGHDKMADKDTA